MIKVFPLNLYNQKQIQGTKIIKNEFVDVNALEMNRGEKGGNEKTILMMRILEHNRRLFDQQKNIKSVLIWKNFTKLCKKILFFLLITHKILVNINIKCI